MQKHLNKLIALGALPLVALAAPIDVDRTGIQVSECLAMPSCAPKPGWECHFPPLWWPDTCDPESPGCLEIG